MAKAIPEQLEPFVEMGIGQVVLPVGDPLAALLIAGEVLGTSSDLINDRVKAYEELIAGFKPANIPQSITTFGLYGDHPAGARAEVPDRQAEIVGSRRP